jgi:hypothetical protein
MCLACQLVDAHQKVRAAMETEMANNDRKLKRYRQAKEGLLCSRIDEAIVPVINPYDLGKIN